MSDIRDFSQSADDVYVQAIRVYHVYDCSVQPVCNPFPEQRLESLLYSKCWIDCLQWHTEDEIRHPRIEPEKALLLKRKIDYLNQERTNIVEKIDDFFLEWYRDIQLSEDARLNSETPGWALDRLSILALKIFHMGVEMRRTDTSEDHKMKCLLNYQLLVEQRKDLHTSINELLVDISKGIKYMKAYRQMKMYNDPMLNPILYSLKT